jgi:hypothetical protein
MDTLPERYSRDYVHLLVQKPEYLFVYWEIKGDGPVALRLHDLTRSPTTLINVAKDIGSMYLAVRPGTSYEAEIGILQEGAFQPRARSNRVLTPILAPVETVAYIQR